jgi:hypothetical protein
MNSKFLVILVLCAISIQLSAQDYPTQNENFIFWQPNIKINFSDFQGTIDSTAIRLNQKYGLQLISSTGIKSALDIPKKSKQRQIKPKKIYFAPVFCKKCSSILSEDSTELKREQLYFDVAEFFTRQARMELETVYEKRPTSDTLTVMFFSIRDKWTEDMYNTLAIYFKEVIEEKQENAHERWAKRMAENLEKTQEYATKPEECYRLMTHKPIEKEYIPVEKVRIKVYGNRIKVEYK